MMGVVENAGEGDPRRVLASLLLERKGIRLADYRDRWFERRLQVRLRATGCEALGSYVEYIRRNPAEAERLLDALSIHVSSFFRDPEVFDSISSVIFASWLERARSGDKRLFRAWSCACARGEEPYSLSMLWELSAAAVLAPRPELKITASDLDPESVACGRAGTYDEAAARSIPAAARGFLEVRGGDRYSISRKIRSRVQFVCEDVLAAEPRSRMDLILCRNLMIFLDHSGQEHLVRSLVRSLASDGYLVLGRAETVPGPARSLLRAVDADHRIFQKVMG